MKSLLNKLFGKRSGSFDPFAPCDHEWQIVSTIISEVSLQAQCKICGLYGDVPNPTKDEWAEAFDAPENPYDWREPERVVTHFDTVGEWMQAARKKN